MIRIFTALTATILLCSAAQSQGFNDVARQIDMANRMGISPAELGSSIRVQVNYQLQVPFDRSGTTEDQKTAITASHGVLYELVAHECQLLQVSFAGDCRITSLSVTNMAQPYNGAMTIPVNANAVFDIVQRVAAKPAAPKP